ncbi:sigma-70 family RNA polymerase sigma factor [Streptomyces sp. ISL-98]|uniref:RNA polymerase sigma factor n=1 Tax=Streptomyces sp. ISL-98 TaxID=2819192 RepID=UPI001BE5681B|nr:sigma-70 family RNA polymerase sigma factor [Streptomyces sp. ISL-98]MBT2508531.1 sigma-70 family RNA polymerase sigma factor [Streptomyces sp. ISL-98]
MQVHVGVSSEADQGETGVTQGDSKAEQVSALWEREADGLLRFAMVRAGCDQAAAEDLVQQTFMAAVQAWESLAGREDEERHNWLRSVCRNKWIDGIRRESKLESLQRDVERLYARIGPDPADAVIARDDLDHCLQVIREFPSRRREVALLYFIEQQSVLRIAELLDIQPSGVRKHVAQARQALCAAAGWTFDEESVETGASRGREEEQA